MKVVQYNASLLLSEKKNFESSHIPNREKNPDSDELIPTDVGLRQFKGEFHDKAKCSESCIM